MGYSVVYYRDAASIRIHGIMTIAEHKRITMLSKQTPQTMVTSIKFKLFKEYQS